MKQFVGLLKMEQRQNGMTYMVLAALSLIVIFLVPYGVIYFFPEYVVEHVRFVLTVPLAVVNFIAVNVMFVSSIHRDIKVKDIWLHNASSIYALVGAKIIYNVVALIVVEACVFIGFFFVGNLVEGTLFEFAVLALFATFITVFIYTFLIMFVYFFTVLYLQCARFIGKFSIIVEVAGIYLYFELMKWMPETTPLQIGKIDLTWLENYMPTFGNDVNIVLMFSTFYVVEEIVSWVIMITIFVAISKWLERVLTR